MQLAKTFSFEAAHRHSGEEGPGGELHGHTFQVNAVVRGPVVPRAEWLTDFAEIRSALEPVIALVDHRYLNDIEGLETGSPEEISEWIASRVRKVLSYDIEIVVECREVTAPETERVPAVKSLSLPERVALKFEASHSLPQTPEGHKCRTLHGHSYRLEAASPDLDRTESALVRIFHRVDHRNLNEIEGLENPTAEVMCRVFWEWLQEEGIEPSCVVVCETCESSCIYFGN